MKIKLSLFWLLSLKMRIALFMLSIFVFSIWALAYYASYTLREDMERLLGVQQASTASFVAMETNQKLEFRLESINEVAQKITPTILNNKDKLKNFLEERYMLKRLFNGGVLTLNSKGIAILDSFTSYNRIGISYADRAYVADAFKNKRATIGDPIIGKKPKTPLFGMAAPIKDASGKVIGALIGITDLDKPNFLDEITKNRYGKSGYYLLEEPKNRIIITGTNKSRTMQPLPPPGVNALIDRHVNGYQDTGITVNPLGIEVLASAKHIFITGWFIVAAMPTQEAFAPICDLEHRILAAALFLTIIAGALTWWMLKLQLSPMLSTVKTLADMSNENRAPRPLPIDRKDEIGNLISGFNNLLEKISKREEALKETQEALKTLNAKLSKQVEEEVGKRLQAEKNRQQEREALIQSEKMAQLGNMLGVILHQWKQPLSAIATEIQGLRDSYRFEELDSAEMEHSVSSIMSKITFMSTTANDFKDFYKPTKESRAFGVIEQILMVIRLLEKQLKMSGISLLLDGDESIQIVGCSGEFKQVILNIINNAKEALEDRKIEKPTIRIRVQQLDDKVLIEIEDNAGGIASELLPDKLFEQFISTKGNGTGIGLSISRTIIEEHMGGKISVKNTQNGACFVLTITQLFKTTPSNSTTTTIC